MEAVLAVLGLAGCAQTPSGTPAALSLQNAASLVGSTPATLTAEFGPPVLRRIDGPAQVWLYHSDVCGLNVILYTDPAGVPRVADAVSDNGDATRCMESLQHSLTAADMLAPQTSS